MNVDADDSQKDPLASIAEWQHREEVAHWKSLAMSLHYENQMLYSHLKKLYKDVHEKYHAEWDRIEHTTHTFTRNVIEQHKKETSKAPDLRSDHENSKTKSDRVDEPKERIEGPSPPINSNRSEELKKLYGSHSSQIAGIEMALQLNFERARAQMKPAYWPELQLNLG